jgi:hypothetical protein
MALTMEDSTGVDCVRCHAPASWVGHIPVVIGGSSGAAKLLFGQLAELNERSWVIDAYRCSRCGHLEMFDRSALPPEPPPVS